MKGFWCNLIVRLCGLLQTRQSINCL